MPAQTYSFEPYDVLQSKSARLNEWLDFSTLRTADEGRRAVALVDSGVWDGAPMQFRIRRGFNTVVYGS